MKKLYIALTFILTSLVSHSQISFQTGYGDTIFDTGSSIILTDDGRYCVVGYTNDIPDSVDVCIYLIDQFGSLISAFRIGMPGAEYPTDIVATPDDGFIIVGKTYASPLDTTNADIFVYKVEDVFAGLVWSNVFGGSGNDIANKIIKTPTDRYIIAGSTESFGSVTRSALAMEIDENGDQIWSSANSAGQTNDFYNCTVTSDGNFVFAGKSEVAFNAANYVVKLDTNGSLIWGKKMDRTGNDICNDIIETSDLNLMIAGTAASNTSGDIDQSIIKLDSSGAFLWGNIYGSPKADVAASLIQTSTSHIVVCGYTNIDTGLTTLNQAVIEEMDSSGNIIWANIYGSFINTSEVYDLIYGMDGGYLAVGYDDGLGDPYGDVFLIKADPFGYSSCNEAPQSFVKTAFNLTTTTNSINQLVTLDFSPVLLTSMDFVNQYSEYCLYDGVLSSEEKFVNVYPNPVLNSLTIETSFEKSFVNVVDQSGRIVISEKLFGQKATIDLSSLSSGFYILQIHSNEGNITRKIIKE